MVEEVLVLVPVLVLALALALALVLVIAACCNYSRSMRFIYHFRSVLA